MSRPGFPLTLSGELLAAPAPRRRGPASRPLRWLSTLMILAGLALAGDVATTLVWQEPVTAVVAAVKRADIDQRWARGVPLDHVQGSQLASIENMDQRIAFLARQEASRAPDGAALGTLSIPEIGVRYQLIQGATSASLELGPGHYRETDLPGEGGTVAIAGHRTTYLAPFRDINELKPGQEIQLTMPYGVFTYVVQKLQIVTPSSWWITDDSGYDRLVLSSCNPLFSAAQRIAVFARLAGVTPTGAAVQSQETDMSNGRFAQQSKSLATNA